MLFFIFFVTFLTLSDFFFLNVYFILLNIVIYTNIYLSNTSYSVVLDLNNNFKYFFYKNIFSIKTFLLFSCKNISLLLNSFSYKSFKWKPLFKRSSYFGIYRSNKNQWLNK